MNGALEGDVSNQRRLFEADNVFGESLAYKVPWGRRPGNLYKPQAMGSQGKKTSRSPKPGSIKGSGPEAPTSQESACPKFLSENIFFTC